MSAGPYSAEVMDGLSSFAELGADRVESDDRRAGAVVGLDSDLMLYTPAQAAALLQVPESWLRRRAAARQVPCTFLEST
jgi:hypothetical protein